MRILIRAINVTLIAALFTASSLYATTTTYTLDADFDVGTLNGVNHTAPNGDQLQLSVTGTTFPNLWVANAGDHTFSKIDTDGTPPAGNPGDGCEVARYYSYFSTQAPTFYAFSGPAPSRTAVDSNGDVYLANRHFTGSKSPELLKFSASGGVDRNGNGVIDTSVDTNGDCIIQASEMLPVVDGAGIGGPGIPGVLDITDFHDERVIWVRQFGTGSSLGRSVCIDTNNHIWAGTYNTREYYKFDLNGNLLVGPGGSELDTSPGTGGVNTAATNYGCAVDASGRLWGATLSATLVELNTNTNTHTTNRSGSSNYGIALGNGRVYLGSSLRSFDPVTNTFGPLIASGGTGVSVDGDGAVWHGTPTLRKYVVVPATGNLNTTPVCSVATSGERGPIIDKDGHAWTINLNANTVSQYDTNCNFISTRPVGDSPYTYSDATGFGVLTQTDPQGIWTVTHDSGSPATPWDKISWNMEPEGNIPGDASITVEARSADSLATLATAVYGPVANNTGGLGLTGQYIEVRSVLRPTSAGVTPVMSDLSITSLAATNCDTDGDGDVDRFDVGTISRNRNTPVPPGNPLWDLNGDNVINVVDGRLCALQCTNANCAP